LKYKGYKNSQKGLYKSFFLETQKKQKGTKEFSQKVFVRLRLFGIWHLAFGIWHLAFKNKPVQSLNSRGILPVLL